VIVLTRRDLARYTLASLAPASFVKAKSVIDGVMIGAQSYSFRDRSLDEAIKGYQETGLTYVELFAGHVEPKADGKTGAERQAQLRDWRLNAPLSSFEEVRKKFDKAGLTLYAFNYSIREDFSDAEIARGFDMAKALGVKYITASSNVSTARRIDPLARQAQIVVGMHNHSNIKPNEFATPDDFAAAMKDRSPYIAINLDIGHFWAAGFDPAPFLEQHHDHIVTLHIKDRKKNQGPNMPFGEGDTPIRQVLQLLKTKQYKIPAMIEYEYKGEDSVAEVKKCYEYCKKQLA
jgi:sugar phosphate isomerase/epimerase